MYKILMNGLHTAVKWLLHVILIPVLALLKAIIACLTYLRDELETL